MQTDTIAAVASGMTQAGIGVIRISGPESLAVADRMVRKKNISSFSTHTVHHTWIYDGEERLDEALVLVMRAPHSYTGEDVVEIQCHGGPLIMERILSACLHCGARLAEPGEFTKRAFLSGRLDLSQAEAVMGLIESQNDFSRKASLEQLNGAVSGRVRSLRERILHQVAYLEAAMDDPEHISLDGFHEEFEGILASLIQEIREMIVDADRGRILAQGIRTVILGRPNAGKSSLWNLLVGEERAIVTQIPGTTRDVLEENIRLGGISLRLVDTAGIRDTENVIEKIGVERARGQAERADLILYVIDSSLSWDPEEEEMREFLQGKQVLVLLNKSDLPAVLTEEEVREKFSQPVIRFSAADGTGREELEREILRMFRIGEMRENSEAVITNLRHREALDHALSSLQLVQDSMEQGLPEDFYTIDLMDAYRELGLIIGESVEEDLVNKIFSEFCMGK